MDVPTGSMFTHSLPKRRGARDEKELLTFGVHNDTRSPKDVTERLDRLIDEIRTGYHRDVMGKPRGKGATGDVLVVAHGHILRAFAMRWIKKELTNGVSLLLDGTSLPHSFSFSSR